MPATTDFGSDIGEALDATLPMGLANYVFALWRPDQPPYLRAAGRLEPGSRVWIASAGKSLAATALLTLVEEGRLDLDAPVSRYLGRAVAWPSEKAAITTRMLLNHTAGLSPSPTEWEPQMVSLRGCVQDIANLPLQSTPGSTFSYGGGGYQVAGLVAEEITGREWCDFVAERITDPADATELRFLPHRNPMIAAGALSTATAYLRYMTMFLEGGRAGMRQVLAPRTVELALQNQAANSSGFWHTALGQQWSGYSFGWWHGERGAYPGAGREFSNVGVYGTLPWFDIDNRYAAVLLTPDGSDASLAAWPSLRRAVLASIHASIPQNKRQGNVSVALPVA